MEYKVNTRNNEINTMLHVGCEVLTAVVMKSTVF
jgi:hypothetical protein